MVERRLEQAAEESRNGGREMKGWQALPDGEFGWRPFDCHSRCAGMYSLNHWIPAFAGMTAGGGFQLLPGGYEYPRWLVPDLPATGR